MSQQEAVSVLKEWMNCSTYNWSDQHGRLGGRYPGLPGRLGGANSNLGKPDEIVVNEKTVGYSAFEDQVTPIHGSDQWVGSPIGLEHTYTVEIKKERYKNSVLFEMITRVEGIIDYPRGSHDGWVQLYSDFTMGNSKYRVCLLSMSFHESPSCRYKADDAISAFLVLCPKVK